MYRLICMAFDGEYVTESHLSHTIEEAYGYSEDMGSRWIFYPFHFVVTESGKTIKGCPDGLEYFEGKRLSTVANFFEVTSMLPEAQDMNLDEFVSLLYSIWYEKALDKK